MLVEQRRWFVRCSDCLSVMALERASTPGRLTCGACGGVVESMGQVRFRAMGSGRPACDARCTMAAGPSCDCACGGANHGGRLVVPTIVDRDGGPDQVIPLFAERARRVHSEWTGARASLEARLRRRFPTYDRLREADDKALAPFQRHERALADSWWRQLALAAGARSHAARLAACRKLGERLAAQGW